MSFGRFARARGNSVFARAFNQELPRRLRPGNFFLEISTWKFLAEKPQSGFAEQFGGLQISDLAVIGGEAETVESGDEELSLAELIEDILTKRKFSVLPTYDCVSPQ